jgi:hypothetical protein
MILAYVHSIGDAQACPVVYLNYWSAHWFEQLISSDNDYAFAANHKDMPN